MGSLYDINTGYYLGDYRCGENTTPPANYTDAVPPAYDRVSEIPRFFEGSFVIRESFKLKNIYSKLDGSTILSLEYELAEGYVSSPPEKSFQKWDDESSSWKDDPIAEFTSIKESKLLMVKNAFQNEKELLTFTSPTINKEVNARSDDILNISRLVSRMERESTVSTQFRLYDNSFVELTLTQIKTLLTECEDAVLDLYHKKWGLLSQIDVANLESIGVIEW